MTTQHVRKATATHGSSSFPIVQGSKLLQLIEGVLDPLSFMEKGRDRYGDIFLTDSPTFPNCLVLGSPEAIQALWNADPSLFECASANRIMRPLVGPQSMLLVEGKTHQQHRKLMMPPFHGKRIQAYGETMAAITQQVMSQKQPGTVFPIHEAMQEITLRVILKTVFGLADGERYDRLRVKLSEMLNAFDSPMLSLFLFMEGLQKDLGAWSPWGKFLRRKQYIDDLLFAEIRDRRQQESRKESGNDVLSLLLAATDENGEGLTDSELRDELMTLLFGGHETTATTLSWAFYWIHKQPLIKEKLLAELAEIGPDPDLMALAKLPYLSAVCNETLRIYPVVPFAFGRVLKQPFELLGHTLAPGTMLSPAIYLVHHNPKLYPNPKEFRPERFLEREYGPHEFLPFGGGNRRCLGYAFAQFEMKVVLATVLPEMRLALASDRTLKPVRRGVTVAPESGVPMKLLS